MSPCAHKRKIGKAGTFFAKDKAQNIHQHMI
jgi:hypothetical protein